MPVHKEVMDEETRTEHLDRYYKEGESSYISLCELSSHLPGTVHATILTYQSPALGLFPRGSTKHARVRDNVMCASGLWHLSLAYR